ncbi:uncharacterized protein LOC133851858 isoform X2 [Alnus glutinosa]|uniref:uncharacterized protein LOC133851858 isoform X2 n=1 Tax=Alnus glutinosa TaxID=3517 RepID=UPI002D7875ED|nr:uncharacterized protein LOC133851858 isoform X2 [Alnus glutinosa]
MASASKHQNPTFSKPPKAPFSFNPTIHTDPQDPKPTTSRTTTCSPIRPSQQDLALSRASHLTRQELLRRRSHYLKQLAKCYRDHYWAFMEELKIQYREYYWKYGVSPFKQELQHHASQRDIEAGDLEGTGENNSSNNLNMDVTCNQRCVFVGCKLKAMPLTSFCHLHILSDSKQKLYKACGYVIKSVHFQKAQKHVTRALKKAGLNVSSSSKLAPKFHVIVTEYVCHIQTKRRAAKRENRSKVVVNEESAS